MIIVIDANILFSALITPDSKIVEIVAYPNATYRIISCNFSIVELFKHQQKITKYSKREMSELLNFLETLLRNIEFYNEALIEDTFLTEAKRLTQGIDLYDANYVALTLKTDGVLWTGDKKLTNHLTFLNFKKVIDTSSLYALLNIG